LVTLDCVRPDHLGCYGYRGVETPNLDRMAASGVLYEQALTHAPNTWVAHASLFTGCFPPAHAMRAPQHRISSHLSTMAEWFSSHGWTTAAFPGTTLVGKAQGFNRGFDLFDDQWAGEGLRTDQAIWRRNWKAALGRVKGWMDMAREPFLIWIHYIDTHHLPEPELPEYYRRRFPPGWQYYDGKISHADRACVGEIIDHLGRRGLLERTVMAVFADHGEELCEDDRPLHDGGLREDSVRIPLVLRLPDGMSPGGVRVEEPVGLVDLFPSLCHLAGLSIPQGIQGLVLPGLPGREGALGQGRILYMENWPRGLLGVRSREWKLILRRQDLDDGDEAKSRVEALYHLPTDPGERNDVARKPPAIVEHLQEECLLWAKGPASRSVAQDEEMAIRRALEGLGYL